jgi:predicted RNA-binding protein with PIN domain
MRWLIDGYNVVRRDPDLRAAETGSLEAGRGALLRLVGAAARRTSDHFVVVFDGAHPRGRDPMAGQVEVMFSRPPRTADDVLVDLARKAGAGAAAVVSSDRAVQNAARRAGCAAVGAEEFLARVRGGEPGDRGDDDEAPPRAKRGNPRRAPKRQRVAGRALDRLRRPPS